MPALSQTEPHYWAPQPEIVAALIDALPASARVLEIGPGTAPFPRADVAVDFAPPAGGDIERCIVRVDLSRQRLPFRDRCFDFVYCRHVIEDMASSTLLLDEMNRVGRSGYVETPSPVAELARGVDAGAAPWRGYHHHRQIVWVDADGILNLVSKYPLVELMGFDEARLLALLRRAPRHWNSRLWWHGELRNRQWQNPLDFGFHDGYDGLLRRAVEASIVSADAFYARLGIADAVAA